MFNPVDTFPYIGLRPFSEDDSLYFKGRDEQILQLTALLEANKFLMVTGASGDGKSSLVYAGLVPNARAGFFKATYANWVIADFRPERTPLVNLSKTLSRNLHINHEDSVELELRRGFSSLVELYTTSSLYLDEEGSEWKNANEEGRDAMQRTAANLLIVADQFEEFFTNPENYYKNAPSADSQLVINLLLETARIAIAKNLPIYIVCTMRSDYIGQCAAFRGLPEFIGFSQFFVPRLKRKEMLQVVKEPAFLHGDKITNRLAERVVYDLGEGIDQLPVLEHALNEVWIHAQHGEEELDLIHYAMAGGMSPEQLPVEDRPRFNEWFTRISPKLQDAYKRPGLAHIIDTHANKLYLTAADHYNERHTKKITNADAQLIIKVTFVCLTKMDAGRAVRNRMTLQEITDIIAWPNLTTAVVGGVLNIFREAGNTFLRPYVTDDPETHVLNPESVLDITHESLIRNWELLLTWANEEYDHLTVYEDFKKQLDRWLESKKSKGFLLPIGPLTFFENWHDTLKPNRYWVNRYLDPGLDKETRLKQAQQIIEDTEEFLDRSAGKVRVTRMVVKYGASRIAAVIGSLLILFLCGFYYWDAEKKKNENVVKTILKEGAQFISDPRFDANIRADFLVMGEFLEPGLFKREMDKVPPKAQFDLIRGTYWSLMVIGGNPELKRNCLYYGDSLLRVMPFNQTNPEALMERLKGYNTLLMTSNHYLSFYEDKKLEAIREYALGQTKEIIKIAFSQNFDLSLLNIPYLSDGLENVLNGSVLSADEANELLELVSPFGSDQARGNFRQYFPAEKQVIYSRRDRQVFNGGYQQMAYLYSYVGNVEKAKSCVDSLLKYHPNYSTFRNNILNMATYAFKAGFVKQTDELLAFYAQRQKVSKKELYELWLHNTGYIDRHLPFKIAGENHNANLELMDFETINRLFDQYYTVLQKEYSDADAFQFNKALYLKHRGVVLSKINDDRNGRYHFNPDSLFHASVEAYRSVSPEYLNQFQDIYTLTARSTTTEKQSKKRRDLFLYPDHFLKVQNNRAAQLLFFTDRFFNFIVKHGYFSSLYSEPKDFELLNEWVFNNNRATHPRYVTKFFKNVTPLSKETLTRLDSIFTNTPAVININANRLRMLLLDELRKSGEVNKTSSIIAKIDFNRFQEDLSNSAFNDQVGVAYMINQLTGLLASRGKMEEALRIISSYPNRNNRIKAYATMPLEISRSQSAYQADAYVYLDSAVTEFERLDDFLFAGSDPRTALTLGLSIMGGGELNNLAGHYVGQIDIGQQGAAMRTMILGTASGGDYYQAYTVIPEIAIIDKLYYYTVIMTVEGLNRAEDPEWKTYFNSYWEWFAWENIRYEFIN